MDIVKVRNIAKDLLHAGSFEVDDFIGLFLSHPFTECLHVPYPSDDVPIEPVDNSDGLGKLREAIASKQSKLISLDTKQNQQKWIRYMESEIDKFKDFGSIYARVNKPYRMYFVTLCQDALSKEEFAVYFADAWVTSENPNGDINVPLSEVADCFEYCPATSLMNEEEYEVYKAMPDTFTVYRGVSKGRVREGFSWTRDRDKALWFASRFGHGFVLSATVRKDQVYAYFSRRGEDEYVINSFKIKSEIASGIVVKG